MSRFEHYAQPAKAKKRRTWDVTDLGILLGLGLVVAGAALVYLPAAFILGGAVLVAVVIVAGGNR